MNKFKSLVCDLLGLPVVVFKYEIEDVNDEVLFLNKGTTKEFVKVLKNGMIDFRNQ